jgi:hypothetical protein
MSFLKFSLRILFLFLFFPHDTLFAGSDVISEVEKPYLFCLYATFMYYSMNILRITVILIVSPVEIFSYCGAHTLPKGEGYRYHINQIQQCRIESFDTLVDYCIPFPLLLYRIVLSNSNLIYPTLLCAIELKVLAQQYHGGNQIHT